MSDLEYHELSTVFSSFEDTEEFQKIVESIKEEGLNHPILVWQGKIVDGRHRHKACHLAGVEPRYEYIKDDTSFQKVMDRVVAENILRRHLTVGQRAMIAASLANMTKQDTLKQNTDGQICPTEGGNKKSNEDAAKSLNVSPKTVKNAKEVKRDAPDLAKKVERGDMSLNAAKTESRERKGVPPKTTNAPGKPESMSLDDMMKVSGDNWDSYVAAGALVSTARDLHLQEGERGMARVIMHFLTSREDQHSHSYNAAGILALYEGLGDHIKEIKEMSKYKTTGTKH